MIYSITTTAIWKSALGELMHFGRPVSPLSPGASWRGKANREVMGMRTIIPMSAPVVLSPARKLGFKFLVAEAAWICSGDNRVSTISPYAKAIASMSDDGQRFFGAYGPKFIDQLSFVVETLLRDPASRQAVISIWREQPRQTKDTPCTLSWQFLIRDGKLHCVATMRSSDIWMGWVYDVFNFSMAAAVVALELRQQWRGLQDAPNLQLGNLYLTAGSQHLYDADTEGAMQALYEAKPELSQIEPLNLDDFPSSSCLIHHLWNAADGSGIAPGSFLSELFPAL